MNDQAKIGRPSTYEVLITRHGPLMNIDQVASLFNKSTSAIRIILTRESNLSSALNGAKKRCGRKLYFRTEQIADFIESDA